MKIQTNHLIGAASASNGGYDIQNQTFSHKQRFEIEKNPYKNQTTGSLDTQLIYKHETGTSKNPLLDKIMNETTDSFPYSHLTENGSNLIAYKGAVFVGDTENNILSLGDMSETDNVLSIPLSDGGVLKVNRDNIDQLAKAIDMFSPKDINRIMKAIATDAKAREKELEIETKKLEVFAEKL